MMAATHRDEEATSLLGDAAAVAAFVTRLQQNVFMISGETSAAVKSLLTWTELNAFLSTHQVSSDVCRIVKDGRFASPATFINAGTHFLDLPATLALLRMGGTLVVNGVEAFIPTLRNLVNQIEELIPSAVHANVYATWKPCGAFGTHRDEQDGLVCQIEGRKKWRVWKPLSVDDHEPAEDSGHDCVFDDILVAGQWLYIPRGWWHLVEGCEDVSLHATIGISQYTLADLLSWLSESSSVLNGIALGSLCTSEVDASSLLEQSFTGLINSETVRRFIDFRKSVRGSYPRFALPDIGGEGPYAT